ncbi:MAG TPA: ammonia-forming cytochrome c nitrite reductase subunit c552 [Thermoanaerobaculia bacterium]
MSEGRPRRMPTTRTIALAAVAAAVAAIATAALLINIFERKVEARDPFFRVVQIDDDTVDPAVWGKNFPLQYDLYQRTVDQERTRFGGSEAVPRTPSEADPRSIVAQSRLEEDPRLRTFWAGYAFSVDFNEERGHAYMLIDQRMTERQRVVQQPGTCLHCHASMYNVYKELGDGDLQAGFQAVNEMTYQEATALVDHPVACIDCHDPETMALRVTRPAFMNAIRQVKAAEGIPDYDVNRDAARVEMRAYVCGQCHVEYYFRGEGKTLTYPWANGLRADEIYEYYQAEGFRDWVHAESGAPVLKAQHPEFEMWNQGTHARAGVVCADCHMPYRRVGGFKVSDHHVRSPLLDVAASCQTCHRASEEELLARAHTIQERTFQMRNLAMDAVVDLIDDLSRRRAAGAGDAELATAWEHQRKAQFLLDFVEAENSMGFHADQEAMRLLALSIDSSRRGQVTLRGGEPPRAARVGEGAVEEPTPGG